MPCLNEAQTLAACIEKANTFLAQHHIKGEVLIADNGSTDGSQGIATGLGARVVDVPVRGYGAALSHGIAYAQGRYIIMGDSDGSYDFSALMPFVEKLRAGCKLVMGNRFRGGIKPGAMPLLHKYLGNPVLSFIGRLFFNNPSGDFHCGLRGFDRAAILALDLQTTGMEFASEMVVRAALNGLSITEVPTVLYKDGRNRPPHLHTWSDGWRHLRFLLMFSPRWLFFYPGAFLFVLGFTGMAVLLPGSLRVGGVEFDVHTLLLSGVCMIVGTQTLLFAYLAKHYCISHRLHPQDSRISALSGLFSLEKLLIAGGTLTVCGIGMVIYSLFIWKHHQFGELDYESMMRLLVPSSVAIVTGLQIVFGAFLASMLSLPVRTGS